MLYKITVLIAVSSYPADSTMTPAANLVLPSQEDADLARAAAQSLSAALAACPLGAGEVEIRFRVGLNEEHLVRVPRQALAMLLQALDLTAQGQGVRLLALHAEMTTSEAAQALGVSRPHLVQLLERGEIGFHRVGSHRRVRYSDVLAYRERLNAARSSRD
jgi:excisionase family DNA binding protein